MTLFMVKLLTSFIMILDHLSIICDAWGFIDFDIYRLLRGIGRMAFPIYAYFIVTGFFKTRNRKKYMCNLLLFAIISQVPFTLALYPVNLMHIGQNEMSSLFRFTGSIGIIVLLSSIYWYLYKRNKGAIVLIFLALVVSGLSLKMGGIWILSSGSLNVFYTLALGLLTIMGIDRLFDLNFSRIRKILIILALCLGSIYILGRSDYGIGGIILIIGLYLFYQKKLLQILYICIWAFVFYGFMNQNSYNALWACSSVILILLYNEKKGISMKYFFYLLYPLHLFLLGVINIYFRVLI